MDVNLINNVLEVLLFANLDYKIILLAYIFLGSYVYSITCLLSKKRYEMNAKHPLWQYVLVGMFGSVAFLFFAIIAYKSYFAFLYLFALIAFSTYKEIDDLDLPAKDKM